MPTPGLSLVGFLDQPVAINHLRNACIPKDPSDAAITAEWTAAQAKLGAATPNAGNPDIQLIPAPQQQHVQNLLKAPWAAPAFQGPLRGAEFKLIEIDPLLAYQFVVDTARCAHHCKALTKPPKLDELMNICLPLTPQSESFQAFPGQHSMLLKARSLNVHLLAQGLFNATFMGIQFGPSLPFLHVVRHNGRCYLHNGFHRAYGAKMAGATHVPCVFRDVPDHASVGIKDGNTFSATLLESANPPTLAHFTQGRAYDVSIRSVSRVLHVSWADYAIPDE